MRSFLIVVHRFTALSSFFVILFFLYSPSLISDSKYTLIQEPKHELNNSKHPYQDLNMHNDFPQRTPAVISQPKHKKTAHNNSKCPYRDYPHGTPAVINKPFRRVVVRSAFRDPRNEMYLFLVEIEKEIFHRKFVTKCMFGNSTTTSLKVKEHNESIRWSEKYCPPLTHTMARVECYELPDVENGSEAFLFYKQNSSAKEEAVQSERPLHIPPPPEQAIAGVMACLAVQYDYPPWFTEWLTYQKTIGISHVHMIAEPSVLHSGALNNTVVQQFLNEGFLSVDIWTKWLSNWQVYSHSLYSGYNDCLYRFMGRYDYIFNYDSDDFFVPYSGMKLLDIINSHCKRGSCKFRWILFYPECGLKDDKKLLQDGNVTRALVSNQREVTNNTKSAFKAYDILDSGTHGPAVSYYVKSKKISKDVAYVAHVRQSRMPPSGCKIILK